MDRSDLDELSVLHELEELDEPDVPGELSQWSTLDCSSDEHFDTHN